MGGCLRGEEWMDKTGKGLRGTNLQLYANKPQGCNIQEKEYGQ